MTTTECYARVGRLITRCAGESRLRLTLLAAVAFVAVGVSAHDDGLASECAELEAAQDWHLVNICDGTIDLYWCFADGTRLCEWHEHRSMRSGASLSLERRSELPVSVHVVACRADGPFMGAWGSPDMEDGSIVCLASASGSVLLTAEIVPANANACIDVEPGRGWSSIPILTNACNYAVAVRYCDRGATPGCFGNGARYYGRGYLELGPGERRLANSAHEYSERGAALEIAACRLGSDGEPTFDWGAGGAFACRTPAH